jgi:type I restriction enzyme S subunit
VLCSWYPKAYFQQTSKQTTNLASTNRTTIGSLRLPLPALAEQRAILARLADDLRSVERLIAQAQREISLIEEYRTRLIADVVTGQLDVCEAARNLPADVEQTEASPGTDDEPEELLEAADDE